MISDDEKDKEDSDMDKSRDHKGKLFLNNQKNVTIDQKRHIVLSLPPIQICDK